MNLKMCVPLIGVGILLLCYRVNADASYTVELNNFQAGEGFDTDWIDWDTMRLKKVSRNEFGVSGDIKIKNNLGNEQKLSVTVYKYDSGSKRKGPLVFATEKPYCEFLDSFEDQYQNMVKYSTFPEEHGCPFSKGDYNVKDYKLDVAFLPNDTPKGDYVIVTTLKNGEKPVSAYEVEVTIS